MFGRRFRLFSWMGFDVNIDLSWFIIAIVVTWSLAGGLFPQWHPGLAPVGYWVMGIAGALGLFTSIVLHEMAHSVVARWRGTPMNGITLFIFGGVAEMGEEPRDAKSEFLVAIAGPLASVAIAISCFVLAYAARLLGAPPTGYGVVSYLGWVNAFLVAFNMIPAFPLDGGRVLRAALWAWKGRLRWATRIASAIGTGFGVLLVVLGAFRFIVGDFVGGFWWVLLGMFIRYASKQSYQHVLVRSVMEGEPVSRFMSPQPVTVEPTLTLAEFVDQYIYKYHHKMFPVVQDGDLLGCVNIQDVRNVPRDEWGQHTVGELAAECTEANTIPPDTDAMKALSAMNERRASRLLVVDNNHLVGVIALKDLVRFLSVKVAFDGE